MASVFFLHERFIKHDGRIRETVGSSCWDDDSADSVMSQVSALMPKLSINQATLIYVQTAWSGFLFGTIVIWNFAMTLSLININAKISLSGFWVVKGDRKSSFTLFQTSIFDPRNSILVNLTKKIRALKVPKIATLYFQK